MMEYSEQIVRQKIAQCTEAFNFLKEDQKIATLEAFREDARLYHSVCFRFVTVIEALFEVAQVVLAEKGKFATGEESMGEFLARQRIITATQAEDMRQMYGFRNRLVHAYGTLDDNKVLDYLHDNLGDIEELFKVLKEFADQ